MGNDGGSIAIRRDLVKTKKPKKKVESLRTSQLKSSICSLTKQPLSSHLMACRKGYIFNADAILNALCNKTVPKEFSHIGKLKHLKALVFEKNRDEKSEFPIVCPIAKVDYNGIHNFILLWDCGHVFSEKAFNMLDSKTQKKCPVCQKPFQSEQVIYLNKDAKEEKQEEGETIKKTTTGSELGHRQNPNFELKKEEENGKNPQKKVVTGEISMNILDRIYHGTIGERETEEKRAYNSMFHKECKEYQVDSIHRNHRFGVH